MSTTAADIEAAASGSFDIRVNGKYFLKDKDVQRRRTVG
jgi:hypothetical protein